MKAAAATTTPTKTAPPAVTSSAQKAAPKAKADKAPPKPKAETDSFDGLKDRAKEAYQWLTGTAPKNGSSDTKSAKKIDSKPIHKPGARTEYPPTGKDNGKKVYFMYGYGGSTKDQSMMRKERPTINDDIARLRAKGYTVVVDQAATKQEFKDAAYDSKTAGIIWSGHGTASGRVATSDGKRVASSEIDQSKVSKNLKMLVLETCNGGADQHGWESKFKGAEVKAWNRTTNVRETKDFNTPNSLWQDLWNGSPRELDDMIRDRL